MKLLPERNFLRRYMTFFVVFGIHCAAVLIPLAVLYIQQNAAKKKPVAFRVKLGGTEPSSAPETGLPSRRRPTETPGVPPPPPPENEPTPAPPPKPEPAPPKPAPPKPEPAPPKPAPPKPAPPKPKPKPAPKPKPKQPTKKQRELARQRWLAKVREQKRKAKEKELQKKREKELARQRWLAKVREQKRKAKEKELARQRWLAKVRAQKLKEQQSVYHDSRWDNKPIGGGSNTNMRVPIGQRDRGQKIGKTDNRTPAGGASADEEKYWQRLDEYFTERWKRPPGVLVSDDTSVIVYIRVDASGRVLEAKIQKASRNQAVTRSAELMLRNLDYIPRPPVGAAREFSLKLIPSI